MFFTWLDLIAPWGTALLAVALCSWAAIKAEKLPAFWISVITGVFFLASIPFWYGVRHSQTKVDYTTAAGMYVTQGEKNKCERTDVEAWESWVIAFWKKEFEADTEKQALVKNAFKGKRLYCVDVEQISLFNRTIRGAVLLGRNAIIGYREGDITYPERLAKHELSHFVLIKTHAPYNEDVHHKMFEEAKLGY